MVPRMGELDGKGRVQVGRGQQTGAGARVRSPSGGWGAPGDAHTGRRREAYRAKVVGEMERGPFKRPSRRSGTGAFSSTPGPVCEALLWGEPSPDPLPGGFSHARSRPALPRGGGSSLPRCLPPPPSSQRPPHLPSYSPLSLLPPTPPRACALKRASVAGVGTQDYSMDPALCGARKKLRASTPASRDCHL